MRKGNGGQTAFVVLLLLAIFLSGCAGGEAGVPTSVPDDELIAEADAVSGALQGVVVDTVVQPIAGATITLLGSTMSTETDVHGRFGLSKVTPGNYILEATKPGFAAATIAVQVAAGVTSPVLKMQLSPDASTTPYFVEEIRTGYIWCAYVIQSVQNCDLLGSAGRDDNEYYSDVDAAPQYLQSEIAWDSTQQLGENLHVFLYSCEPEGPCGITRLCGLNGPAPIVCRVTQLAGDGEFDMGLAESDVGEGRGLRWTVSASCAVCDPARLGMVVEQQFHMYTHLFYNFEPSGNWQFSTDGAPVIPA